MRPVRSAVHPADIRQKPLGVQVEGTEDECGIANLHAVVREFREADVVAGEIDREEMG